MRNILVFFIIQITLGCDSSCLEKRLEVLERRYDTDLNFQELTRAAHEEFDDKIETILVWSIQTITYQISKNDLLRIMWKLQS